MATSRVYRSKRSGAGQRTRARIVDAVRELLLKGSFHQATVEEVAARAGVSRATLYQHFGSRMELIDALCDSLAVNPELVALRAAVDLEDPADALDAFISRAARFWASEERLHHHLYGLATIDPAAADYVRRQREDRRGEVERLARRLHRARALRPGLGERGARARLLLLTSFEGYDELRRHAGLSVEATERTQRELAREVLLG